MTAPVKSYILVAFLLLLIAPGFAQQPAYPISKKSLYGNWTSDRPLYGSLMKISFKKNGKYAEIIKDVKTNVIKSSFTGSFKLINDSTIRIKSKTTTNFHMLHFMNNRLIRFYAPSNSAKAAASTPLYMYNFVRDKY